MIDINLLPVELRPVDRTPLPRLMAILSGVLLVVLEGFFLVFLFLQWVPTEKNRLDVAQARVVDLRKEEEKIILIKGEMVRIHKRVESIGRLYDERFTWARLLDRLAEPTVLPDRIWINKLEFEPPRRGVIRRNAPKNQEIPAGTLRLECFARAEIEDGPNAREEMMEEMQRFIKKIEDDKTPVYEVRGLADLLKKPRFVGLGFAESSRGASRDTEVPDDAPGQILTFTLEIDFQPKKVKQPGQGK